MRYLLENEQLKVEIDSFGAEIKSVQRKSDAREYMWCGDKNTGAGRHRYCSRLSVCQKDKEYRYEGKTYSMGQHGFARDMEFTLEKQGKDEIWFVLHETEETLAKYPFTFTLHRVPVVEK